MDSSQEKRTAASSAAVKAEEGGKLSYEELAALYDDSMRNLSEGEIVNGRVIHVTGSDVIVDIGFKSEGLISIDEFRDREGKIAVNIGDTVEVLLEQTEDSEGHILLSKQKAERMLANHRDLDAIFAPNESSTEGVLQALKKEGAVGRIKLVGFDGNEVLISALKAAHICHFALHTGGEPTIEPASVGREGLYRRKTDALEAELPRSLANRFAPLGARLRLRQRGMMPRGTRGLVRGCLVERRFRRLHISVRLRDWLALCGRFGE